MKQFRTGRTRISAPNHEGYLTIYNKSLDPWSWIDKKHIPAFIEWLKVAHAEYLKEQEKRAAQ